MDLSKINFRRKFSVNFYKNLKFRLSEMSAFKDWVTDTNGDPYPLMGKSGEVAEKIENFRYCVSGSGGFEVRRFVGQFFPYANMAASVLSADCEFGFSVLNESGRADITAEKGQSGGTVIHFSEQGGAKTDIKTDIPFEKGINLIVNAKGNTFFTYLQTDKAPVYVGEFTVQSLGEIKKYEKFSRTSVSLITKAEKGGSAVYDKAEIYMDCGVSQADIRPVRYENGEIITENGKIYLTASVRDQRECYQGVFSWKPSTCEFEYIGAIFYDAGDGSWEGDVAASLMFNRKEQRWMFWVCSFSHGHVLAHGTSKADIRFGVNVVDITLMKKTGNDDLTEWSAKENDEDPDFIYDEEKDKWYMTICRSVKEGNEWKYRYFMFESDRPFEGYRHVTHSLSGNETGGSIIKINGKYSFICGSDFDKRSVYHIYPLGDFTRFETVTADFPDGGFRGWGSIIPITCGSRNRLAWLTFDRHGGSDYRWSYGNIYGFESDFI